MDTAWAGPSAFGIRGGLTDDPDTVFMGGHIAIHPSRAMNLRIEPSAELGIGEDADLLTLRINANFKYMIPLSRDAAVYPLFGPSLVYYTLDDCSGCNATEVGLNLGGGFAFSGFAFDLILGFADIPDLALTFSYTFW